MGLDRSSYTNAFDLWRDFMLVVLGDAPWETVLMLGGFIIITILFCIFGKKHHRITLGFLGIVTLLMFEPHIMFFVTDKFDINRYFRYLWIIPCGLTYGYAITWMISHIRKEKNLEIVSFILSGLLAVCIMLEAVSALPMTYSGLETTASVRLGNPYAGILARADQDRNNGTSFVEDIKDEIRTKGVIASTRDLMNEISFQPINEIKNNLVTALKEKRVENNLGISSEIIEICDILHQDENENGQPSVKSTVAAGPESDTTQFQTENGDIYYIKNANACCKVLYGYSIYMELRTYDASFYSGLSKDDQLRFNSISYGNTEVQDYVNSGQWSLLLSLLVNGNASGQLDIDNGTVQHALETMGYQYVIIQTDKSTLPLFEKCGTAIGTTDHYTIIRIQ
ncbi:MAG: hypothetical protein ACI4ET_00480 [Bilifractor sp.]